MDTEQNVANTGNPLLTGKSNDDDVCEKDTEPALTCCQVLSSSQHGTLINIADHAVWTARMPNHGQQRIQAAPPAL